MSEVLTREEAIALFHGMTTEQLDQARRLLEVLSALADEEDGESPTD